MAEFMTIHKSFVSYPTRSPQDCIYYECNVPRSFTTMCEDKYFSYDNFDAKVSGAKAIKECYLSFLICKICSQSKSKSCPTFLP